MTEVTGTYSMAETYMHIQYLGTEIEYLACITVGQG